MSLVKNMDNWSDMSKLDLLYKFSIIKYLRYFIIPELFGLSILVIASIKIRGLSHLLHDRHRQLFAASHSTVLFSNSQVLFVYP